MQENNFVMPGVMGAFFLKCSAQSHQLCSIGSLSQPGLVRFEQLIIHAKLIPSNTQHEFFSLNFWLSMLKHGQMVPMISSSLGYRSGSIFHHSDYMIQKILSFMPGKHFTYEKSAFSASIWNPIPLLLNHSQ